jgi:ATP-dependent helicase/DNAse subunit B
MKIFETDIGVSLESVIERGNLDLRDESLYLILPDIPAIAQAERLFLVKDGLWGERLLTFGKFSYISNLRSKHRYNVLSKMGRLFLMEELVTEVRDNLVYFSDKHGIKGFSEALLRLVAELKHAKIEAERISKLSESVGNGKFEAKLKDLSLIYTLYQKKLTDQGLIDDIEKLRLLSETIAKGELHNVLPTGNAFVVFGFFDFTPSQLEVLQSIDKAGHGLAVYVPSLAGTSRLRDMVRHKMRYWLGDFQMESLDSEPKGKSEIEIHSFPSFREEAEFAARKVKSLLLSNSVNPQEIAVVVGSVAGKENYLAAAFERMAIPYSFSKETSLRHSLLGRFVIELLKVKSTGFEKKNFLNLLRSPYVARFLTQDSNFSGFISELDKAARKERVLKGAKSWENLLDQLLNGSKDIQVDEVKKRVSVIKDVIKKIKNRFSSNYLSRFIEDLVDILDELLVYEAVKDFSPNSDLHVQTWKSFYKFIKELRYLAEKNLQDRKFSLAEFISFFEDLLSEETYSVSKDKKGNRVEIIDALQFRGTSFPVVFVLDVGEKSFPAPALRDPILKHDERIEINKFLSDNLLNIDDRHYDAEEFLFNLISGSASRKLYMTYSYLDESERSALPSYLVEEIAEKETIETQRHYLEESFIYPENIYSSTNLAKHIFHRNLYKKEEYRKYLGENAALMLDGLNAERRRLAPRGTFSEFEGIINQRELLPELAEFSPTGLETYGDCPFKYFAGQVLKLEFPEEPEDEVAGLDLGSFYHRVLKSLFSSLSGRTGEKVDLRAVSDNDILDVLKECIEKEDLNKQFGWLSPTVRELIVNRVVGKVLPQFIVAEAERIREWNDRGFFPENFEKPIVLNLGNIGISGQIDRVDKGNNRALIIDYKFRSSYRKKFFDYVNLQLPIYLSALRNEGIVPYGGYYRFVEKPDLESGAIGEGKKTIDELMNAAMSQVKMYVSLMKEGFFAPVVKKKEKGFKDAEVELSKDDHAPCGWCEFKDLCRVQGGTLRKL